MAKQYATYPSGVFKWELAKANYDSPYANRLLKGCYEPFAVMEGDIVFFRRKQELDAGLREEGEVDG